MIKFVTNAANDHGAFESRVHLDMDIQDDLDWMEAHSVDECNAWREAVISAIEADARSFWDSGAAEKWFSGADVHIQKIAGQVNGPLFELLAKTAGHTDVDCPNMFRHGAQLLGKLPVSGNGVVEKSRAHRPLDELWKTCAESNKHILRRLKEDENADEIMRLTMLDAELGRTTCACPREEVDLEAVRISQRFGVNQGMREDGSEKVRCVDSCTESGINPCTEATEHLSPDGIDHLFEIMRTIWCMMGVIPHIQKIDVDSAVRRVPIAPDQRWAAVVAFMQAGRINIVGHLAMPFGAASSVFAWDRVGAAITKIARVLLKIPLLRYMDDMFSAERQGCVEHCRDCIVRLVRALLGPGSVSAKKVCSGLPLDVLGVTVDADECGAVFWPSDTKVEKWISRITNALQTQKLSSGASSKLAGALSWSAQHIFCRLGRALLRPMFAKRKGPKIGTLLNSSLRWWLEVLTLQIQQRRSWVLPATRPVQLFCDARGSPPRLAAVIITHDGSSYYTDMAPPQALLKFFIDRRDKQICALELCAIALGLSTFGPLCAGLKLHVWSDNCGSEHATRRGSAKAWDHNRIVHALWVKAATLRCHMIVDRVPTKENIADLPSREEYALLRAMNADAWSRSWTICSGQTRLGTRCH